MRYPYVFVLSLFLGLSLQGQSTFKKATLKRGDSNIILAEAFIGLSGSQNKGTGTIVVSFILTKNGEIIDAFPQSFDTQKNGINAILAIQKTSGLWTPTIENGKNISQKYKIAYNFLPANNTYELDVKMADKHAENKMYKQALKYYDKAIKSNPYEADLYLKRAEIKLELEDMDGLKKDLQKCKTLQKEFLANVLLGLVKPTQNTNLSYNNKK